MSSFVKLWASWRVDCFRMSVFVLVELLQRCFHSPSLPPGAAAGMCSRLWSVGMESPWAWGWRTFTEYLAVMIDGAPLDPLLMNAPGDEDGVHANTERLHRCRGAALLQMWRRFRGQQRLGGCEGGGGGVNQITAGPGPGPGSRVQTSQLWMQHLDEAAWAAASQTIQAHLRVELLSLRWRFGDVGLTLVLVLH